MRCCMLYPRIILWLSMDYLTIMPGLSLDDLWISPRFSLDYPWIIPRLSLDYPWVIPILSLALSGYLGLSLSSITAGESKLLPFKPSFFSETGSIKELTILKMYRGSTKKFFYGFFSSFLGLATSEPYILKILIDPQCHFVYLFTFSGTVCIKTYRYYISSISLQYLRCLLGISLVYLKYITGISQVYFVYISGIS